MQRLPGGGRWRFLILDKTVERPVPPFSLSLSPLFHRSSSPPLLVEDGWTRVTTSPVRKDGIAKLERKQRDCLFDGLSETIQTRYLLPRPSLSFFDSLAAPWWSIWIPPRSIFFRDLERCIQVYWLEKFFLFFLVDWKRIRIENDFSFLINSFFQWVVWKIGFLRKEFYYFIFFKARLLRFKKFSLKYFFTFHLDELFIDRIDARYSFERRWKGMERNALHRVILTNITNVLAYCVISRATWERVSTNARDDRGRGPRAWSIERAVNNVHACVYTGVKR